MHVKKKRFGQNFLKDKNLLKKIVKEADIKNKAVIEIGPGAGALTEFLVLSAKTVTAYEIDFTLKPILNELEEKHNNLKVIYEDILKINIDNEKEYHVVANIPYNITSPIIFKILETKNIKSATLMMQKEVVERISAKPGEKQYNALTVTIAYYMETKKIMDVKKHMFTPPPKVDSAVVKFDRREKLLLDIEKEPLFLEIVKASFMQKRKTIVNNLANYYKINKTSLNNFLSEININQMSRAEDLSLENFIKMTEKWQELT